MKKVIKITAMVLCLLSVLALFTGCGTGLFLSDGERLEKEKGVSYDNIVFRLEISPKYGFCCGRFSIVYTLFADNRLEAYTGGYDYDGVKIDVIEEREFRVTEGQREAVIQAFRDNSILSLGQLEPEDHSFAVEQQLYLFDGNGNAVHQCGGINPIENERYDAVFQEIFALVPYDDYTDLVDDTRDAIHDRTNAIRTEELGISFEHTVLSYEPTRKGILFTDELDMDPAACYRYKYTVYADGTMEITTGAVDREGNEITYVTETIQTSQWRVNKLIEIVSSHLDFEHLYYTDNDAEHLYDSGIKPVNRLCTMDGVTLNGEPMELHEGSIVFYDKDGKEHLMLPVGFDYAGDEFHWTLSMDVKDALEFAVAPSLIEEMDIATQALIESRMDGLTEE